MKDREFCETLLPDRFLNSESLLSAQEHQKEHAGNWTSSDGSISDSEEIWGYVEEETSGIWTVSLIRPAEIALQ